MKNNRFLIFILLVISVSLLITLSGKYITHSYGSGWETELYYRLYNLISQNKKPFIDFFTEYPPFASFILTFPMFFIKNLLKEDFWFLYYLNVGIWMTLFFSIQYFIFKKLSVSNDKILKIFSFTFLLICLLYNIIFTRYDIFPAILTSLAISFYILFLKFRKLRWIILSALLLALAINLKVYPVVILPIFLIIEYRRKNYKNIALFITIVVIVLFMNLPFFLNGQDNTSNFVRYQTQRDFQIESTYASGILGAESLGLVSTEIKNQNGAFEISPTATKELSRVIFLIIAVISLIIYFITFIFSGKKKFQLHQSVEVWDPSARIRKELKLENSSKFFEIVVLSSILLIFAFILFNKVFSPQYLNWLVMLIPLFSLIDMQKNKIRIMMFTIVSIAFLTDLIYPIFYNQLTDKNVFLILILILRNILLIYLFIEIFILFLKSFRQHDQN